MEYEYKGKTYTVETYDEMVERQKKERKEARAKKREAARLLRREKRHEEYVLNKDQRKGESILYIQRLPEGLKFKLMELAFSRDLSLNTLAIQILQEYMSHNVDNSA